MVTNVFESMFLSNTANTSSMYRYQMIGIYGRELFRDDSKLLMKKVAIKIVIVVAKK